MSFSRPFRWRSLAPYWVFALAACSSSPSSVTVRTDGRLRLQPTEFTTEVGCGFASGSDNELGHYVATLIDLGASPDTETEGPSTDTTRYPREAGSGVVTRCTSTTTFSTAASDESIVETGHIYAAIVDGYGGVQTPDVAGAREDQNWAAPAWQWLCGIGGLDETQLQWLVKRAQWLKAVPFEPAPQTPDAAVSPTTADAALGTVSGPVRTDGGVSLDASVTTEASAPAEVLTANPADAGDAAASSVPVTTTSGVEAETAAPTVDTAVGTSAAEARDAGVARDWWAELLTAAESDIAPPAKVVGGRQSGVRGCVPLF